MMFSETDLGNTYQLVTSLARKGIFSLTEINEMLPYELNLYTDLAIAQIAKEKQELENARKAGGM